VIITEVSGQPIGLIFNDQEIQFCLFLDPEDGIQRLFRDVGKNLQIFAEYYRRAAQIFAVALIM